MSELVAAPHLLTSSRLKVLHACPRQHHYRYELAIVSQSTSRALALGSAVHAGLESWWRARQDGALPYALPSALVAAESAYPSEDRYAVAMLRALLTAYDARWSAWAETVTVLGVEVPFATPLLHPVSGKPARTWRVAGKIDVLARLADGRVAIIEHKTSSQDAGAGSDYRRKLTLDPQVSTYFEGAAALGHEADVCLYDVLKKPTLDVLHATPEDKRQYTQPKSRACKLCKKNGKGVTRHVEDGIECTDGRIVTDPGGKLYASQREHDETPVEYEARLIEALAQEPDRYLVHAEIVRSERERDAHRWALWRAVEGIEQQRKDLARYGTVDAVPQHASACLLYGSPCAYLPVCEGTARIDDDTLYVRLASPHVELGENETNETNENRETTR